MGIGYGCLGNSTKSIQNYEEAKNLLTDPGDIDQLRAACNNVGNSYRAIGVCNTYDIPRFQTYTYILTYMTRVLYLL